MTYVALAWLVGLMLAANAAASIPDGFGMTVFFVTLWSLIFVFQGLPPLAGVRLARAWSSRRLVRRRLPQPRATTYVERDYDDTNCDTYDNCDGCDGN